MDDLINAFLEESQEGLDRVETCLTELERQPEDKQLVGEIFRAVHTIKGTTGFLVSDVLKHSRMPGESLLAAVREGRMLVTAELVTGLLQLMDGLRRILHLIRSTGGEGGRGSDNDRELIELLLKLQEGKVACAEPTHRVAREEQVLGGAECVPLQVQAGNSRRSAEGRRVEDAGTQLPRVLPSIQDKTVRIDVAVLNRMMNLVGELVLTRNQILQSAAGGEHFSELGRRLNSVTAELRESVMQARMQPVGHLFNRFPRLVRDLARQCGRQVRIEFEGQETGLDKSLLEAIADPLTHAVRNAVDHGIEPVEGRVQAGKPLEGVVRMRAFHKRGWVAIEVEDDGAGIAVDRVLKKAVERGLVTQAEAGQMTEREALQLIFLAGFSTAEEVSSVSGRGVGMDVVRANVEKVGGSVELESRAGAGTTVRLRVPLTLAIVPALVVRSGGQSFAVPQNSLAELLYVPASEVGSLVERMGSVEVYRLRERLLPLVRLDRLLGLKPAERSVAGGVYLAVMDADGCRFVLVVDDLMPPEEIVVKPLSGVLRQIGVFSGATVLGSGQLAMILDVAGVSQRAGVRPVADRIRAKGSAGEQRAFARGTNDRDEVENTSAGNSLVIYEVLRRSAPGKRGRVERMAMPLALVERIETVPRADIEQVGGRHVLQYRGEVLALEDEGGILSEGGGGPRIPADPVRGEGVEDDVTVLICLRESDGRAQHMGVVVLRVLDVSAGLLLDAAMGGDGRLAMVNNQVTEMHGGLYVGSADRLREVA